LHFPVESGSLSGLFFRRMKVCSLDFGRFLRRDDDTRFNLFG
jgi:hypothetical protein